MTCPGIWPGETGLGHRAASGSTAGVMVQLCLHRRNQAWLPAGPCVVKTSPKLSCEGLEFVYRTTWRSTVGPWSVGLMSPGREGVFLVCGWGRLELSYMDISESTELKLKFLPWDMNGKDLWLRRLGASLQDPYHPQPEPRPMDLFPKAGMTSKFLGRWCWWQFCGQKRL